MKWPAAAFGLIDPLLRILEPETAHGLTIRALRLTPNLAGSATRSLRSTVFGIEFLNPLGLAAGFDKNGEVPDAMLALGFGHVEIGSVTPRPQPGNPRPRLFRLVEDGAVINRMGFNSEGHDAVVTRLRKRKRHGGVVAVNLGANRDSSDRVSDYVAGLRRFCGLAAYVTVNVSSPNTPGLRDLQSAGELERLVASLTAERDKTGHVPIVVKIAPDLDESELNRIGQTCLAARIDGIAVSNTTTERPHLMSRHRSEPGGLSGRPLFSPSTRQLARLWLSTKGAIPLIGIGGISDAETAWTKITAGASLLQLYTALVYRGPGIIDEILQGIEGKCREQGYSHFREAIGSSAESLAHQGLSGT